MIHTLAQNALVKPLLDPESRTAAATSSALDCRGFTNALIIIHLGAHSIGDADETIKWKVQQSSDNGVADAYADVTGLETAVVGAAVVPNATHGNIYLLDVDLQYLERYLKVVSVIAGTTNVDVYGVSAILYNASEKPVTQDATPIVHP